MDTELVVDTFVDLADTLARGYDVTDFMHTLADRCVETFAVAAAGVFLPSGDRLELAAASDSVMERLQEYENAHFEGPCMDAFRTGEPVVEPDLKHATTRWPGFAPEAIGAGFQAGYAFPLRLRTDVIGALNMYRGTVGALDDLELRVARGYADAATIGILHERQSTALEKRAGHLQHALDSRIVIEQAKGVLVERHGLSPDAAFHAIRTYARSNRRKLSDVCNEIISGAVADGLDEAASA